MKISHIWSSTESFEILQTTDLSQCAVIRLVAGDCTSEESPIGTRRAIRRF